MTVTTYEAYAVDVAPPENGSPVGPLVGGPDALRTSDGATSYASVSHNGLPGDYVGGVNLPTTHTFRFGNAGPIPAGSVVTVEADWRTTSPDAVGFSVRARTPEYGARSMAAFFVLSADPRIGFGDLQLFTVPGVLVENFPDYFTADALWEVVSNSYSDGITRSLDITRLTLIVETPGGVARHPVRLIGRGDGLGMGSNRLIGVGNPQSSVRLFGSL